MRCNKPLAIEAKLNLAILVIIFVFLIKDTSVDLESSTMKNQVFWVD